MDLSNAPFEVQIREMVERAMARLNTAIPGVIQSFNSSRQTATVTPAIKIRTYLDGVEGFLALPPILEVPVLFPRAGGFALTFPVAAGDPCLIVFSQRAIDNWLDRGGIQPPEQGGIGSRHHDLTDAFALLAPAPIPEALSDWAGDGVELRNNAKDSRITVKDDVVEIETGTALVEVSAEGSIEITAAGGVTINGPLTVTGAITSQTSVADPTGTLGEIRSVYNNHNGHNYPGNVPTSQME